jgi:hypothetical protein
METVAMNFHDESGAAFGAFQLHAGDDAGKVKWTEVTSGLQVPPCANAFHTMTCSTPACQCACRMQ